MLREEPIPSDTGRVRFLPAGDTALVVELGDRIDKHISARILDLKRMIANEGIPGLCEIVPSFRSLLVQFDPLQTDAATVRRCFTSVLRSDYVSRPEPQSWLLPVCYAERFAPDIGHVSARTGLSVKQLIELHSSAEFSVYFLGFLPGCALLGDLPAEMETERRVEPRTRVPAGSVAMAMRLTIIYPLESPGGWHLIGNCPALLFDHRKTNPSVLAPGDSVRFRPVSEREYEALLSDEAKGGRCEVAYRTK